MKERPILFTPENVRAILDGRKTQTRRIVKLPKDRGEWESFYFKGSTCFDSKGRPGPDCQCISNKKTGKIVACAYGQVGHRLWVRESVKLCSVSDTPWVSVHYPADDRVIQYDGRKDYRPLSFFKKTPSIHMPRWACRLVLGLTDVRVERLKDCSEADAKAEGCYPGQFEFENAEGTETALESYLCLWESINGFGSWQLNPWVWVLTFKPTEAQP